MSNNGFSAPIGYFGTFDGLKLKSSQEGLTSSLAEATDANGDVSASDRHGSVSNPTCEFAVIGEVDLSDFALGTVYTRTENNVEKRFILTNLSINTSAGSPPTVTLSGAQCETTATTKRTYSISGTLTPRCRAQDVVTAFSLTGGSFKTVNTTFSVDPHIVLVGGVIYASDVSNGRVEVQAEVTDAGRTATVEPTANFNFSATPTHSNPDVDYASISASAVKFVSGTDVTPSQSLQSSAPPASNGTEGGGDR